MSTILVIGSTGNIGSFVVKELIERGASVKAAVTNSDRGKMFFSDLPEVEVVTFDFLSPSTYKDSLKNVSLYFFYDLAFLCKI